MCDQVVVGAANNHEDDRELLVRACRSPDAFAAFYRRHVAAVLAYYRRRGATAEQALDLTAEAFAAALESIERYRPGSEPGVAWLYGIARNVLAESHRRGAIDDRARRRLGVERLVVDDEALLRVEERIGRAAGGDLQRLVEGLPEHERQALVARVVDERSYKQIAASLKCSEQLVRKRVSRGLGRLRAALAEGPR